tara:strand:- start:934 stop:1440 length:507 start_codon:yes stop_codon:yes gene_type:complete
MANKTKFLVVVGILIGIGAALLFIGSQSITADIVILEGKIDETNSMRIDAFLDPEINAQGVFAVQTLDDTKGEIVAKILDPSGTTIIVTSINEKSFEEIFEITSMGTHTLVIDANSDNVINVVGGVGHVPDSSSYSISMAGFFMLLAGMIGVLVVGIILVRERKKNLS